MFVGGMIYLLWRQPTWLSAEVLSSCDTCQRSLNPIRDWMLSNSPPSWVLYQVPDMIWAFCFSLTLLLLNWNRRVTVVWVILVASLYEILQYLMPEFGTFDWMDIVAYGVGILFALGYFNLLSLVEGDKKQ